MIGPFAPDPESYPTGWAIGYCRSCQQEGPVRIHDIVTEISSQDFGHLWWQYRGQEGFCDFCNRRIKDPPSEKTTTFLSWKPTQGMSKLLEKLEMLPLVEPPDPSSAVRIHSLLLAVQKGFSLRHQQLNPISMAVSGAVGCLAATPLFVMGAVTPEQPHGNFLLFCAALGVCVLVLLVGGYIDYLFQRGRTAVRRIETAYLDYSIDLDRLRALSQEYKLHIRRAVQQVCMKYRT